MTLVPASSAQLTDRILDWGRPRLRDLPWRKSRDPWSVLVAEVMLQQTQVGRVLPRWSQFLSRFPDPGSCAAAPVAELIKEWSGLGYNRRAVNLHRCAFQLVTVHGGNLPDDLDELLKLPGVGPYIARAVLVFAFERNFAVVDTNVTRILKRHEGRRFKSAEVQELADDLLPHGESWIWNQVLLDFGATICRSRNPLCAECPVSVTCVWGGVGEDPAKFPTGIDRRKLKFEGSDRQGRGRLVEALRNGSVSAEDLTSVMGWGTDVIRAKRIADQLVIDGLILKKGEVYLLP